MDVRRGMSKKEINEEAVERGSGRGNGGQGKIRNEIDRWYRVKTNVYI